MRRPVALVALLLLATPLLLAPGRAGCASGASSDVCATGALPDAGGDAAQLYCLQVFATAHASNHAYLCDAAGTVAGVTTLRLRVAGGEGHAYAYALWGTSQSPVVDCRASMSVPPVAALPMQLVGERTCLAPLGRAVSGPVELHVVADGPAGLVVEAQLERTDIPAPLP